MDRRQPLLAGDVGLLTSPWADRAQPDRIEAVSLRGLQDFGYVEGQNLRLRNGRQYEDREGASPGHAALDSRSCDRGRRVVPVVVDTVERIICLNMERGIR
jgi:hypothetical protein